MSCRRCWRGDGPDCTLGAPAWNGLARDRRRGHTFDTAQEARLDHRSQLDGFLAGAQNRAFKIARMGTRNDQDALDVVQDAMLRLARGYANRPPEEWPALFHRILTNRIRDWQRRQSVRQRFTGWLPGSAAAEESQSGPVDRFQDTVDRHAMEPPGRVALDDAVDALEVAIGRLPARQREAFLLRSMEGLDVAATAKAMGCSQGSVKTHYSRAVHALRDRLGDHWP